MTFINYFNFGASIIGIIFLIKDTIINIIATSRIKKAMKSLDAARELIEADDLRTAGNMEKPEDIEDLATKGNEMLQDIKIENGIIVILFICAFLLLMRSLNIL